MGVIMQDIKKRVFLLAGHAQSGKTSISEAILFKCGAISRLGKVEEGNTVSDYEEDEKERKSSVNMSVLNAQYQDNFLQFIDTPGYLDFIGELISASKVVDFGVIVVDAASGIEVGTEKAWEILRKENLPCIFLVNKLDKENTDFNKVVLEIQNNFTKKAVPFAFFENNEIFDVLSKKDSKFYSEIVEVVAETDDKLLEKYLEKGEIEETELNATLKKAIMNSLIFPILPCIATTTLGIENLIKVVVNFMPSPSESLPKKVIDLKTNELVDIKIDLNKEFLAFVFKTIIDPILNSIFLPYTNLFLPIYHPSFSLRRFKRAAILKTFILFFSLKTTYSSLYIKIKLFAISAYTIDLIIFLFSLFMYKFFSVFLPKLFNLLKSCLSFQSFSEKDSFFGITSTFIRG